MIYFFPLLVTMRYLTSLLSVLYLKVSNTALFASMLALKFEAQEPGGPSGPSFLTLLLAQLSESECG